MKKFIPLVLVATVLLVGCGSGEDDGSATAAPPAKEGAVGSAPKMDKKMPSNTPTGAGGADASSNIQKPAEKPAGM